ncbi:alpha/beta fold hydrolase [Gulosibacter sp. 10]|uniref:alpha/beta fold hydrolase n=1 Tax=Gulosibacter sp. 10 TaxID=1255570 RepID=UPI00097EA68E|nr:alpha/beta fold hydrolase [Gulosibacter sp. 10]SJM54805.1 hydrolase, alpha/beta fold family [Gulosibacter sp. 10]
MSAADPIDISLPDGRRLAGATTGPETGRPVLFIAGAGTGRSMTFGEDLLEELGVRLLTMDRPGMAGSTAAEDRTLASTAEDYRAFATRTAGTDAVPIVANSQGAAFGLAAAAAGWPTRLVLVSPADELAHPPIRAMLPEEATGLADLAATQPERAEAVLRGFTAEAMERMVLEGAGEADRARYSQPEFLERYRRALAEGFANDARGYARDTLLAMRTWRIDFERIGCPVDILFGAEDLGHSPDHGATLAGRIPSTRREVLPDAGGALLWTHAREVLDRALA